MCFLSVEFLTSSGPITLESSCCHVGEALLRSKVVRAVFVATLDSLMGHLSTHPHCIVHTELHSTVWCVAAVIAYLALVQLAECTEALLLHKVIPLCNTSLIVGKHLTLCSETVPFGCHAS